MNRAQISTHYVHGEWRLRWLPGETYRQISSDCDWLIVRCSNIRSRFYQRTRFIITKSKEIDSTKVTHWLDYKSLSTSSPVVLDSACRNLSIDPGTKSLTQQTKEKRGRSYVDPVFNYVCIFVGRICVIGTQVVWLPKRPGSPQAHRKYEFLVLSIKM